jgi:hypothetical protein
MFSKTEQGYIKERVKLTGVAKDFGVSSEYVRQILNNERAVKSEKSKEIRDYLKGLIEEKARQN